MNKNNEPNTTTIEKRMRASFEASLPGRINRATQIDLQNVIPAQWFAAAASECASMYISGFFYRTISGAQAYVEALYNFLGTHHQIGAKNDPLLRWKRLKKKNIVSKSAYDAACLIFDKRNDFYHLNEDVEQNSKKLECRAKECVNHIHTIESEVFAHSFDNGKIILHNPKYWPGDNAEMAQVHLRQIL